MDVKDQVKRSVSIMEVASMYVDLKPAGKYYKALCPFHTEKTPSFFVMPEKDAFTCYGCNKFGDIFTLVQEMENLNFLEAMNFLIDKFSIPIEKTKASKVVQKDIYAKINEMALKYYRDNLYDTQEGKNAENYLKERGIDRSTIELFSLGYAENRWDGLFHYLGKKSVDIEKAVELGLLIRDGSKRIYDRFRGRIIFPIFSESGTLLAFGGRTIFDEPSKYLNSPDNPLYKKSHHLYGFNLAKKSIREDNTVLLVEGYFDVISLYQHGVKNATASLGTALTDNQIYLLKRFTHNIHIFYDSDQAGIAAAVRGIEKMFEQNINPRIIILRDAKDPDDFIREKGLKVFKEEVQNSIDGFRFLLKKIDGDYGDWRQVPERKKAAIEKIKSSLEKIADPIVRDGYKEQAADYFRIDVEELRSTAKINLNEDSLDKGLLITPAERIFLESILSMPEYINHIKGLFSEQLFSALASGNIIRQIFQHYDKDRAEIDYNRVTGEMNEAERAEFRSIIEALDRVEMDKDQLWEKIESSFLKLQDMLNKRDTRIINQEIKIAERENDFEKVKKLTLIKYKFIKEKYNRMQEV